MKELISVIYLLLLSVECVSLLIRPLEWSMAIFARSINLFVLYCCHQLRQRNSTPLHLPERSRTYMELLVIFIALEVVLYFGLIVLITVTTLVGLIDTSFTSILYVTASIIGAMVRLYVERHAFSAFYTLP
jgi:hypothetical protein